LIAFLILLFADVITGVAKDLYILYEIIIIICNYYIYLELVFIMKRKINKVGTGTLTISLPRDWVKKHGLKKGDEIDVFELDGNLCIGEQRERRSEVHITLPLLAVVDDLDKSPKRYLLRVIVLSILRKGYDKITLEYPSPSYLPKISSYVDEILGYEITEQSATFCTIENVISIINMDITKYFSKFKSSLSAFFQLVESALLHNAKNAEEIYSSFLMLEKTFNNFCRFLTHDCQNNTKEKMFLLTSMEHLYQGSRNLYYASKLNFTLNRTPAKTTLKYAKEVFDFSKDILEFISSKDLTKVADLTLRKNKVTYHDINRILTIGSEENAVIVQLCFVARRMWDSVGPYIGSII
jgi:phosphate uptake regulator